MFQKFIACLIFLAMAAVFAVIGSASKTIVCSNQTKKCTAYTENSLLKTKSQDITIDVSSTQGTYMSVGGVFEDNTMSNLTCKELTRTVQSNSCKKNNTTYYLVAIGNYHNKGKLFLERNSLATYSSKSACEFDRAAIQRYLKSNDMNEFKRKLPSGILNFLWYAGVVVFLYLAYVVVFKARILTEAEAKAEVDKMFTEEQKLEMQRNAVNIVNSLSKIDGEAADKISNIAENLNRFNINIDNKDK